MIACPVEMWLWLRHHGTTAGRVCRCVMDCNEAALNIKCCDKPAIWAQCRHAVPDFVLVQPRSAEIRWPDTISSPMKAKPHAADRHLRAQGAQGLKYRQRTVGSPRQTCANVRARSCFSELPPLLPKPGWRHQRCAAFWTWPDPRAQCEIQWGSMRLVL